jgi:sulfite exporter TauE/SafE
MSPELTLWGALVAGLVGSAHCAGMCGGITGALGLAARSGPGGNLRAAGYNLAYSTGRILSYATAGAIAGWIGEGLRPAGPEWAAAFRILTAVVLILIGLQVAFHLKLLAPVEAAGARLWRLIGPRLRPILPPRHVGHALLVGAAWGWLPCGLVYGMLVAAAVAGGPAEGAAVMAVFGLGTLPAMTAMGLAAGGVTGAAGRITGGWRRAAGVLLIVFGLWTAVFPVSHLTGGGHAGHGGHGAPAAEGAPDPSHDDHSADAHRGHDGH